LLAITAEPKDQCFVVLWFMSDYYPLLLITAEGPRYSHRYEIRRPRRLLKLGRDENQRIVGQPY
jgi:hypothetical protein